MAVEISQGGELFISAGLDISPFEKENKKLQAQMQSTTKVAQGQAVQMENLGRKVTAALGAFAGLSIGTSFIKDIARVRGEMQQLEVAFTTMLHSKAEADKLMSEIATFAATTPFELKEVVTAAKQLLAFGFSANQIEGTLRSLGDVAAALGQPLGEIAYLYGTIRTAGTATAVDIKQFAQRGIPIYEELAAVLKVNTERVNDMVSAGKVGFPEVEKAFQNMTAEGSAFGGLMEKQSETIIGLQSNLQDAINQMLNEFGKSSEGFIAETLKGAISLVENYEKVIDVLKTVAFTYGTYRAAILLSTAATNGQTIAEVLRSKAILLSNKAMTLLNATMLKNPFVLTATLVGALAAKFIFLNDTIDESKIRTEEYSSELKKEKDALTGLFDKVKKAADGTIERKNAIQEINKQYGTYLPRLISEVANNNDLIDAYEVLNKRIEENIALKFKSRSADRLSKEFGEANDEIFDEIFSTIKKNAGPKAAGEATQEFNNLVEQIEKIDNLRRDIKEGIKQGNLAQLYTQEFKLIQDFARKFNLKDFQAIKTFAVNRVSLKRGMKDIDEFYDGLIAHTKKTNDQAQKTLEDYLKDNNFLSVVDQALNLATTKGSLELIKKKLEEDKNALNARTQKVQIDQYLAKIDEVDKIISGYDKNRHTERGEVKENTLLKERKSLLQDIADAKRTAQQSTMTQEQSAIDRINEKYELLTAKVVEYNKAVDRFNEKNPKDQIQKIGQLSIAELNASREIEINAEKDTRLTEDFKKNLEVQQSIYQQYENSKKEIGEVAARDLFKSQTGEFDSYIEYLESESQKIGDKINQGLASVGDKERFSLLKTKLDEENQERLKNNRSYLESALKQTITFLEQESIIRQRYDKMIASLDPTKESDAQKIKLLTQQRERELQGLKDYAARQTEIYELMTRDIIGFTEKKINENIATLRKAVEDGFFIDSTGKKVILTPAMRKELKEGADQAADLAAQLTVAWQEAEKLERQAQKVASLGNVISGLSQVFENVNHELAAAVSQIGALINGLSAAAGAMSSFKNAQAFQTIDPVKAARYQMEGIMGIASAALSVTQELIQTIEASRESARIANEEVIDFQARIIAGEYELAALYRQKERDRVRLNKLTREGMEDELALLKEQQAVNKQAYDDLLKKIQQEQYIESVGTKRTGAGSPIAGLVGMLFGLGKKTEVDQQLESLAGKSFEDLEKLFLSGQLTDKAKEYFLGLQKLQEEGLDIDQMLKDSAREWNELLTGTTSQSIGDSIIEGLRNGKASVKDFADDFEDLMRGAMFNSLKFQLLEPLVEDFHKRFAEFAETGGEIDEGEKGKLKELYDTIVQTGIDRAKELEKITGISLANTENAANSMQGQISRSITEETGSLIVGQFNGLRITAIDHLRIAGRSLDVLVSIDNHTANLISIDRRLRNLEENGIKIK